MTNPSTPPIITSSALLFAWLDTGGGCFSNIDQDERYSNSQPWFFYDDVQRAIIVVPDRHLINGLARDACLADDVARIFVRPFGT